MIQVPLFRIAVLALALAPLAACGFAPVYGSGAAMANSGPIDVLEIQSADGQILGRTSHFLRRELIRTVGPGLPGLAGAAQLDVKVAQNIERLAFTPDQAASRSDYVGVATWTLRLSNGATLQTGSVHERASFNFADSAFADLAAQTAAQERLATLLARSIRDQMIMTSGKPLSAAAAIPGGAKPPAPLLPATRSPGGQ